jgi:hypothetical protein
VRTAHERYRAILLVAHSNAHGLQLTNEDFADWTTIATWLESFAPQYLVLIACDAGQFTGICTLFRALPALRKVYASPVTINSDQVQHLNLLIEQLITERRVDDSLLRITQALSFLTTKGILFQWTRADCQDHNKLRGVMETIGAQLLK